MTSVSLAEDRLDLGHVAAWTGARDSAGLLFSTGMITEPHFIALLQDLGYRGEALVAEVRHWQPPAAKVVRLTPRTVP